VVATGVVLYDDASHGDAIAGDRVFTNDGSVPANPTYTFGTGDTEGPGWLVRVFARDGSASAIGATNGHVHRSGLPNAPEDQANFWNIDEQVFTFVKVDLVIVKSALTLYDPHNGASNPKAIPGAVVEYTMTVTNQGEGASDVDSVRLADAIPVQGEMVVTDIAGPGSGPVLFTQGTPTSGLSYSFVSLTDVTDDLEFSSDGGSTWTHMPMAGPDGTDPAVTHFRILPAGAFAANAGTAPSFTLAFRIRVK
jgi:uncharacterized repeat protein (TIGR01451 family)